VVAPDVMILTVQLPVDLPIRIRAKSLKIFISDLFYLNHKKMRNIAEKKLLKR
jgi:hypothetical protein